MTVCHTRDRTPNKGAVRQCVDNSIGSISIRTKGAFLASLLCFAGTSHAWAWGREGHAVVADIAEAYLTPQAHAEVTRLLALESHTDLVEISSWADDIRRERPFTSSWHYVDIPLAEAAYDPARDCRLGNCVVEKINSFAAVLGDRAAAPQARIEALKFLTHFVADEAQPLHAEDNGDKGGNDIPVDGFGAHANLHSIWDTAMVQADDPDAQSLADRLKRQITGDQALEWGSGTPAVWATESHAIAISAYAALGNPRAGSTISIPQSYIELERPVVETQLEKAGIRLATILNRELR